MPPSPHSEFFVRVFYLAISNQNIQIIEPGPLNETQHKGEPLEKERANQVTCNATLLYMTYQYR